MKDRIPRFSQLLMINEKKRVSHVLEVGSA